MWWRRPVTSLALIPFNIKHEHSFIFCKAQSLPHVQKLKALKTGNDIIFIAMFVLCHVAFNKEKAAHPILYKLESRGWENFPLFRFFHVPPFRFALCSSLSEFHHRRISQTIILSQIYQMIPTAGHWVLWQWRVHFSTDVSWWRSSKFLTCNLCTSQPLWRFHGRKNPLENLPVTAWGNDPPLGKKTPLVLNFSCILIECMHTKMVHTNIWTIRARVLFKNYFSNAHTCIDNIPRMKRTMQKAGNLPMLGARCKIQKLKQNQK